HIYSLQDITWGIVWNEIAILTIGISVALLINLYMPSVEKDLKEYQQKVECNFKTILFEMAVFVRNGESNWDGKELLQTEELL
ncbi:aromatic acid exporter family protein, partial [Streptococcus sobrinus]|uniref:aromatic acid exporter family protein n=1 Tax=Streptococcus sobrinus TaxID=1310 RepID=UPI0005B45324